MRKGSFVMFAADRFGESAATNWSGVTVPPEITDTVPFDTARKALAPPLTFTVHPEKLESVHPASNAKRSWGSTALIAATYATGSTMRKTIMAARRSRGPIVPDRGRMPKVLLSGCIQRPSEAPREHADGAREAQSSEFHVIASWGDP